MRTTRTAAYLSWEAPSVDVRWRPLLSVVIVTQLVTRSGTWLFGRLSPVRARHALVTLRATHLRLPVEACQLEDLEALHRTDQSSSWGSRLWSASGWVDVGDHQVFADDNGAYCSKSVSRSSVVKPRRRSAHRATLGDWPDVRLDDLLHRPLGVELCCLVSWRNGSGGGSSPGPIS